jgi:hypothetical protein
LPDRDEIPCSVLHGIGDEARLESGGRPIGQTRLRLLIGDRVRIDR